MSISLMKAIASVGFLVMILGAGMFVFGAVMDAIFRGKL